MIKKIKNATNYNELKGELTTNDQISINTVIKQHPLAYILMFVIFNIILTFLFFTVYSILQLLGVELNILSSIGTYFLIVITFLEIIIVIYTYFRWKTTYYVIKPRSIITNYGVFFRQEKIFIPKDVTEIDLDQGFLARICDYGTIILKSQKSKETIYINNIKSPQRHLEIFKEMSNNIDKMNYSSRGYTTERSAT